MTLQNFQAWAFALLLPLALLTNPAHAVDYFGKPDAPPDGASVATPVPVESRIVLPEPLSTLLGAAIRLQSNLNARLRTELESVRDGHSSGAALTIILASFLYGVLHAVGPGHGKVVVTSYLLSRRTRFVHALGMSSMAAATQALTAIALVGVLAALFGTTGKAILNHAATIELASYGAIAVLGLWMAWNALRPNALLSCGCVANRQDAHVHHDPDHEHEHDSTQAGRHIGGWTHLAEIITTGGFAGLRPCSGAILVLLFTLANGIFLIGVVAAVAMSIGVAITVASVGIGAFGINRLISTTGQGQCWTEYVGRGVAFAGALVIAAFGAIATLALSTGVIAPMVG
jgi:nickel/cobalt transporter (NicO) family protein